MPSFRLRAGYFFPIISEISPADNRFCRNLQFRHNSNVRGGNGAKTSCKQARLLLQCHYQAKEDIPMADNTSLSAAKSAGLRRGQSVPMTDGTNCHSKKPLRKTQSARAQIIWMLSPKAGRNDSGTSNPPDRWNNGFRARCYQIVIKRRGRKLKSLMA